jgi:two-component system, cell cycle sensor histidine kinase and response regulator CckA
MLIKLGFQTEIASNGNEVIEKYKKSLLYNELFKFVIFDLIIPGDKGGEQIFQEILKLNPDVKGIVSSGYSKDPIIENYKNYGFIAALPKPYDLISLGKIIDKIID